MRLSFGLPTGVLDLRRAWPRDDGHLLLEYTDGASIIAGQWFADPERLEHAGRDTANTSAAPSVVIPGEGLLLQGRGSDRRLTGLAALVDRDDACLLSHRAERRAVVRLEGDGESRYARCVRTDRWSSALASGCIAASLCGRAFTTPRFLEAHEHSGVVIWSGLPGSPLHDLIGDESLVAAAQAAGRALAALRAIQGLCTAERAQQAIAAFLQGYAPSPAVLSRVDAYADATRLRLACLYAFRPRWCDGVPAMLLDRIGNPTQI